MMNEFSRLVEIIERHDSFFLVSHIDPDGDAIGSLIALFLLLTRKGKKALAYDRDGVPEIYRFLECSDKVVSSVPASEAFDVVIFLECPNVGRAGAECEQLIKATKVWVNLDHHFENARFGHLNIIDPGMCAVAEMIFDLYGAMGEPIDLIAGAALYTAIMTDTGSYKYSNTSPRAHEISAKLIKLGVKPYDTYEEIFGNLSPPAAMIAASAHSTLEIDGNISCITITRAMLEEAGATAEDTHDIVNLGRGIADVEVALLFRETENGIKVSLRSKGGVEVNKIAGGFGGGGHLRAAGCTIQGDMAQAKDLVYTAVREALRASVAANADEE